MKTNLSRREIMKLLIKTAWLMMIVTLSSFDWIFGFIAVGIWLTVKLYDLLLIAEDKEMAKMDRRFAPIVRDDERFKRRMEENY
jgi:hypothetical protein